MANFFARRIAADSSVLMGYLAILTSPLSALGLISWQEGDYRWSEVCWVAFFLGWLAAVISLWQSGSFGRGRFARLATLFQVLSLVAGIGLVLSPFQSWLGVALGCGLFGALASGWRAQLQSAWSGWTRWCPLACGICLPVGVLATSLFGEAGGIGFAVAMTWCFAGLGVAAVRQALETDSVQPVCKA